MTRLVANTTHRVIFTLNGEPVAFDTPPRLLLTDALRHLVGATGTHVGCEHGVCGACTILIDGAPARACLTLAVQAEGCALRTVEGLAPELGRLNDLQEAFRRHHALQCGFCTAGILISLDAFLARHPRASESEIREVVGGHLCRCTGYDPIIKAALDVVAARREEPAMTTDNDHV